MNQLRPRKLVAIVSADDRREDVCAKAIAHHAETLREDLEGNDRAETADVAAARAIQRLAELEADRPGTNATDAEREAFAHKRAFELTYVAGELLEAVGEADVVSESERGQLQAAEGATREVVADHHLAGLDARREAREPRRTSDSPNGGGRR